MFFFFEKRCRSQDEPSPAEGEVSSDYANEVSLRATCEAQAEHERYRIRTALVGGTIGGDKSTREGGGKGGEVESFFASITANSYHEVSIAIVRY